MTWIVDYLQAVEPDELAEVAGVSVTVEPELDGMGFNTVTVEADTRDEVLDYVRQEWGDDDQDWFDEYVVGRIWPSVNERVSQDEYGDAVFTVVGFGRNGDLVLQGREGTTHHAQPRHLRPAAS